DAGQSQLGPRQCGSCGMLFAPGIPEDRIQHLRHHQQLRDALRLPGWKDERVVAEFWDGKIVLVLPEDPKHVRRKAEQLLELVDSQLGLQAPHSQWDSRNSRQNSQNSRRNSRIYLFVDPGKSVLGVLVAEAITQ
ncbi:ESCO2 acetyltransferase, partial [Notiomystis cincta]|nr:ESCO2 acetyltransferase [Notiomystis cincta]